LLFDRQKQLTYLHYIGISAKFFEQVCAGKNILFPYRDLFLYYRYLRSGQVPELMGQPIAYDYSSLSRRQQWTNKARQLLDSLHLSAKR
ncbi:MAG: hypothetical protein AAFS04_16055, partial [Cyanobacteria bacterium J06631_9]